VKATFVWMPGSKKPHAQIWYGDHKKPDKDALQPLAQHVLKPEELEFSLMDLAKLYPLKGSK
jgi:hypothetical protein